MDLIVVDAWAAEVVLANPGSLWPRELSVNTVGTCLCGDVFADDPVRAFRYFEVLGVAT